MTNRKVLRERRVFFWLWLLLTGYFLGLPEQIAGQTPTINSASQGDKAVWSCSGSCAITGSTAVVDASALCETVTGFPCAGSGGSGVDFCRVLNHALMNLPTSAGVVVDTRGIVPGTHGPQGCSIDPFNGVTYSGSITVLLPASTIQMNHEWLLPSNTRLVGEGPQTILQAQTGFAVYDSSNALVEMGNSSICRSGQCTGISIEHLKVDGHLIQTGVGLNGIYNANAQDSSYVDDVDFVIGAAPSQTTTTTALWIGPGAANSGPYSNILLEAATNCTNNNSCTPTGNCACGPTACVKIQAATRGLHGITCTAKSLPPGNQPPIPAAAIYLDASGNTIEDVHVEGFYDAVVVGDNADGENATVAGNTLVNILSGVGTGPVQNAVHICSPITTYVAPNYSACMSNSGITVQDLSILGAQNIGIAGSFAAHTIQDDLTGAIVNSSQFPAFVAKYVLGEAFLDGNTAIGYTRFTTSPGGTNGTSTTVPTWTVGGSPASISCSMPGALYSNTNGNGIGPNINTVYVCSGGQWKAIL